MEMVSQPDNPYQKMLLILGRDDNDLITAVEGIAQGELLRRARHHRQRETAGPAPAVRCAKLVRTDRRTTFGELTQYQNQLQADGLQPNPISLTLNLPPDLFWCVHAALIWT